MIEKNIIGQENIEDRFPIYKTILKKQNLIQKTSPVESLNETENVHPHPEKSNEDDINSWEKQSKRNKEERNYHEKQLVYDQELIKHHTFKEELTREQEKLDQKKSLKSPEPFNLNPGREWLGQLMQYLDENNKEIEPTNIVVSQKLIQPSTAQPYLQIAQVMTQQVCSVLETTSVEQVTQLMNRKKISGLPVVHYKTKYLLGIITMSDIIQHIFDQKSISTFQSEGFMLQQNTLEILEHPVKDYMSKKVFTVSPSCSVEEACQLMVENRIHRLVVTQDELVVGIFTSLDATRILSQLGQIYLKP